MAEKNKAETKPRKEPDPILGVRVPKVLKEEFEKVCRDQDITPAQICRKLINNWLIGQRKNMARRKQPELDLG